MRSTLVIEVTLGTASWCTDSKQKSAMGRDLAAVRIAGVPVIAACP